MITVKYSCAGCGIQRREVQVPARTTEDVVAWIKQTVAHCLSDDHGAQSPQCRNRTMSEVMIPIPKEAEFIGQQIE